MILTWKNRNGEFPRKRKTRRGAAFRRHNNARGIPPSGFSVVPVYDPRRQVARPVSRFERAAVEQEILKRRPEDAIPIDKSTLRWLGND